MGDDKKKDPITVTMVACNVCSAQQSFAKYTAAQAWADVHLALHRARRELRCGPPPSCSSS